MEIVPQLTDQLSDHETKNLMMIVTLIQED